MAIEANTQAENGVIYNLKAFYYIELDEEPPPDALVWFQAANPHAIIYWTDMSLDEKLEVFRPLTELLADDRVKQIDNDDIFVGKH